MATIARLGVEFFGDHAKYDRSVRHVTKGNAKLKGQFSGLARSAAALFLSGGLAIGAKRLFDIGAAAEETASKFRTVFGPATQSVQAFIDDFASMAGLSQTAARDVVATTGAIAQGMGVAQEASGKFSIEVVKLAGDLASFNNIPIEETSRSVQAALTGEYESLKRLGIAILDEDVKRKALVMTGKEHVRQITHLDKVQARLALVTERAGVAVGDLVRTQDSAANTARKVSARYTNLKEAIAIGLQPAFKELLNSMEDVTGALDDASAASITFQTWTITAIGKLQGLGISAAVAAAGLKVLYEASMVPEALKGGKGLLGVFVDPLNAMEKAAKNAIHPVRTVKEMFGSGSELVTGKLTAIDNAVESFNRILDASIVMRSEIQTNTLQAIEDLKTALAGLGGDEAGGGLSDVVDTSDSLTKAWLGSYRATKLLEGAHRSLAENMDVDVGRFVSRYKGFTAGIEEARDALGNKLKPALEVGQIEFSKLALVGTNFADGFAGAVAASVDSGIASFKRFADSVIRQLIRIAVKMAVLKLFDIFTGGQASAVSAGASGGMGGFGRLFGRASGGPVSAGSLYSVNERGGSEVFAPSTSGRVYSLGTGPSAAPPVNVHVHLYADDALRFTQSLTAQQKQNEALDDTHRIRMPVGVLAGA